jgi:diacylglycerol O-acyltransferase / wax synthase
VQLMAPADQMFVVPETRETPMHVGGLQLFDLPPGASSDYVAQVYAEVLRTQDIAPAFKKRLHRSVTTLGQWSWVEDDDVDLEHHVRLSALPRPGRVRELLALVSRLHGTLLDRSRPLWEAHLIEGLEGDRFAVYTKVHHAMMDGVSAMRLLERSLSTDPEERGIGAPFALRPSRKRESGGGLSALPGAVLGGVTDLVGLSPRVAKIAVDALRKQSMTLPMTAPRSVFNTTISGSRRFAADDWPMERIRAVAKGAEATVNDVVLAMCSGALRAYLLELDALPDASLTAMTPVSLRDADDEGGGNAVGTILCSLGTHLDDDEARLLHVKASMRTAKQTLAGLSQLQVTALSAAVMAPLALQMAGPLGNAAPPPFNLIISNVPGPAKPLYWNGARLTGNYPLSIPTHGQALNITVTSYAGDLQFGLTGCRKSVPHLQRLLAHLDEALTGLEKAFL